MCPRAWQGGRGVLGVLGDVGLRLRPQPRGVMRGRCPAYGPRAHPRLEGTCGGSRRWQSITSVVPLPPGLAMAPQRAGRPGGAGLPLPLPPAGGGRPPDSSSGRSGASNEPRGHPGCLPCPAFPSLSSSFFHLKMGETSQAAGPGLPSSPSPSPPPLSPRSGCSLAPTVGKGTPQPGGDITGVSSLRAGGWAASSLLPVCPTVSRPPQPLA